MATRGRGKGRARGGDDLRGTLGSLIRSTIDQVGAVREAVERGARNQRVWIDGALLQRKYREALAELGETVYELAASGELGDLAEHPELAGRLDEIRAIDERLTEAEDRVREATAAARDTAERLAARAGLPTGMLGRPRTARRRGDEDHGPVDVWRPPGTGTVPHDREPDDEEDGTVAAVTGGGARPERRPPAARGRGGISFVDEDEDLADYMHPDDVPAEDGGGEKK